VRAPSKSIIVQVVCSAMIPFAQLFALYVITHGHYGAGGGFQGGAIFGSTIILQRLYLGKEASYKKFPPNLATMFGAIGMLIYMLAGLIPMATGGMFLDYGHLPIPGMSEAALRGLGILIVEIGIALAVFGTMVLLFDSLAGGKQ
jgi:multicomponent Na+:H+ antiporter subunit B